MQLLFFKQALAVCALISYAGIWAFAWVLNVADRVASSNLVVFACMGVIVYLSVKKMGKTITLALACSGLFGVVAVAFSGFCLALLLSTVIGWITNAVNDLRIPLTIAATCVTALGVYWADLQRVFTSAKTSPEPNNNRERSGN